MTAWQAYVALRDAILDVAVTQRSKSDRLVYYAGPEATCPNKDRHLTLAPFMVPMHDVGRGCNAKSLRVRLIVRYQAEPSGKFRERYLLDADEISDTILTMPRSGGIRTVRIELGDLDEASDTELSWFVVVEYLDL